jgi:predicted RNase H-like HicB family nuclease
MDWLNLTKEDDGRWFGEVPSLPGVMAYGVTKGEAQRATEALMRAVVLDRIEHDEVVPEFLREMVQAADFGKKKPEPRARTDR